MNAGTSYDSTQYTFSLPSNKLELWFSMESSRFLDPVLRELAHVLERATILAEDRREIARDEIQF